MKKPEVLRPGSGEIEDFDVVIRHGYLRFTVRLGDGAPYAVYLRPERAIELADAIKRCVDA